MFCGGQYDVPVRRICEVTDRGGGKLGRLEEDISLVKEQGDVADEKIGRTSSHHART